MQTNGDNINEIKLLYNNILYIIIKEVLNTIPQFIFVFCFNVIFYIIL